MQLLGQSVNHRAFGDGVITGFEEGIVTIAFHQGEKRFQYPDAFSRFLTLRDSSRQEAVNEVYTKQVNQENAEKQKARGVREKQRRIRSMAISPCSQAAFNLEEDLSAVFEAGSISTGCYLSGASKGEPRLPSRMKPNSCCLLTSTKGGQEADRKIIGMAMVHDDFWGETCEEGCVPFHAVHRLELPEDAPLSYWDYFEHGARLTNWGRTAFKYFKNELMQQILFDAAKALAGTPQEQEAQDFCRYFNTVNRLNPIRRPAVQEAQAL